MEIKLQRGIMDAHHQGMDRQGSGDERKGSVLLAGSSQEDRAAGLASHWKRGNQLQRTQVPGLWKMNYEELADRIWDATSPDLTEAAMVIRQYGRLSKLYNESFCVRCKRAFSRPFNWLAMRSLRIR